MATRLPNYQMRDGRTRLGQDYFNPIWADLDSRLDTLERIKLDWNAQVAQLRDLGLQRIDEYIRPVVDEVDALLAQATEETNGLAQELVNEHLQPLVDSANALLTQVQNDTDTLAQDLVDQHLQPKVDEANTLLAQAQQSADDLATQLEAFATTASRTDPSTDTLLQAKAMNDHRQSADHDARYYRKAEVDAAIEEGGIVSAYQEFTVSGIWTKDPAATWVYVEAIGAGASGQINIWRSGGYIGAIGGAGGEFAWALLRASELGSSESIAVGAGGPAVSVTTSNGATQGPNAGGDSSFGSHLTAKGAPASAFSFSGSLVTYGNPGYSSGNGGSRANGERDGGDAVRGGAAGGGAYQSGSPGIGGISQQGGNGGDGARGTDTNLTAQDGIAPGGGGGAAALDNQSAATYTVTSGKGGDGVVRVWQW